MSTKYVVIAVFGFIFSLTGNTPALDSSTNDAVRNLLQRAAAIKPEPRQLEWQKLEFNVFIHFGPNSFTGREWGTGQEDPKLFNPAALDCRQWARLSREA